MIEEMTLTPAMVAHELADVLHERAHVAMYQLVKSVRELGPDAAYDLAARALFIEATGGLPLGEPWNRKRTPGGMFFYLLKAELDDEQHQRVFGRVRKPGSIREPVIENVCHGAQIEPVQEPAKAAKQPKPKTRQPSPDPSRPCAACEQPTAVVGKFHFGRTGKRYLCAPCVDTLGFVFSPSGSVIRLQEQAA